MWGRFALLPTWRCMHLANAELQIAHVLLSRQTSVTPSSHSSAFCLFATLAPVIIYDTVS